MYFESKTESLGEALMVIATLTMTATAFGALRYSRKSSDETRRANDIADSTLKEMIIPVCGMIFHVGLGYIHPTANLIGKCFCKRV